MIIKTSALAGGVFAIGLALSANAATLKMAYDADPVSLDPHEQLSGGTLQMSHMVFDPLIRWTQDLGFEGRLAQRWERVDGQTVRFYLRTDVKFHSGNSMTAADVLWTFNRLKSSPDFKGIFEQFETLNVLDDHTFELCKKIVQTEEFLNISKERIYEEYKKLFLKSKQPSLGLQLLNKLDIEQIDELVLSNIDEIIQNDLNNTDTLILTFSILDKLFLKISDDKKLLKKIQALQNFQVPRILEKNIMQNDSFITILIKKLNMLNNMPKPLYIGKDLIKMGYKPSEKFKSILDTLYKMQLNGEIC